MWWVESVLLTCWFCDVKIQNWLFARPINFALQGRNSAKAVTGFSLEVGPWESGGWSQGSLGISASVSLGSLLPGGGWPASAVRGRLSFPLAVRMQRDFSIKKKKYFRDWGSWRAFPYKVPIAPGARAASMGDNRASPRQSSSPSPGGLRNASRQLFPEPGAGGRGWVGV